jgi:hypothetical protein
MRAFALGCAVLSRARRHAIGGMGRVHPKSQGWAEVKRARDGTRVRRGQGAAERAPTGSMAPGWTSLDSSAGAGDIRRRSSVDRPSPEGPPARRRAGRGEFSSSTPKSLTGWHDHGRRNPARMWIVAIRYLDAWLRGSGAGGDPILMEDRATARSRELQLTRVDPARARWTARAR